MKRYRKKIGIDARFLLRPLRGMPLYVTRLCQYLPAASPETLFYLFVNEGFQHNDSREVYRPRVEQIVKAHDNVRIVNVDDEGEAKWEQVYLPRLVREHDICLLHMPANRYCFKAGVPTVVTVHDVMEYLYLKRRFLSSLKINWYNPKAVAYLSRVSAYALLNITVGFKSASRVITVSDHSAGDIQKYLGISRRMIRPIHHGVDDEFFSSEPCGAPRTTAANYVLMLGGDSYQKNAEGAISAWAKVPKSLRKKFPLKVAGFCGNDRSPLLSAIREHGLAEEVEVEGWITQEEMIERFKNATLFLYLSRYEGFGLPLLQAMAAGTPVISTGMASIPEIVDDRELLYHPDDYDGVAAAIERLLTDPAVYVAKANAGRERARQFHWQKSAELHLDLYEEVLRDVNYVQCHHSRL